MNMPASFTRKSVSFLALLFCCTCVFAAGKTDTLKQKINLPINNVDSLKHQLEYSNDSLKGQIYTRIAMQYMRYDTVRNKKTRTEYQEAALKNTMSALHYFSRLNDSTGLRECFDRLAIVYHAQKKYAQAKWFILQSNSISRIKNDVPNIITSLVELASVKRDIKDYSLAMRDLKEALQLSTLNHFAQQESQVQLGYAMLYARMDNPTKSAGALKRHLAIDDSIKKAEEKAMIARVKAADSIAEAKKKAYLIGSKVLCGQGSSNRQVSSESLSYSLLSSR
jgi:tetratricopeptide (TPR) repeat protein